MATATTVLFRLSFIFILLSIFLFLTYPAWAQDATTPATRKEKAKERVETRKEIVAQRVDTLKERMATREAALKAKLDAFRDKKKATAAARISENLNRINDKQTEQMLKHLDKMTSILNRLEDRVNRSTPDIKDATLAQIAIADAKAAIATASSAVKDQSEKDYTVEVSSESKVRADFKKVRDMLHADLKSIRESVIKAKQAVANAIRVAKSGKLEIPKEGTPSGRE